jgi:Tfp pilus assembly protein FimV
VAALGASVAVLVGAANAAASAGSPGAPSPTGRHASAAATRAATTRAYVVRPGDTLWALASRIAGPGSDPRPVVDELVAANRLSGPLQAGSILRLPAR